MSFLPLQSRPLMILSVELCAPQLQGNTPLGQRKIVPVRSGTVEGERIRGKVLEGGADWALVRADGVLTLDVRLTIETDDGALIYCTYAGVRHGPEEAMKRLAAGEYVDPMEIYFRTLPRFETASPDYAWLNRILCVGIGERLKSGPRYFIHEIL